MSFRGAKKLWEKILLKRSSRLSKYAKELLDEVIDSEPRSTEEILERMYDEVEKRKKKRVLRTGRYSIPTRRELQMYLNSNYNSDKFSKLTGARSKGGTSTETRYWK